MPRLIGGPGWPGVVVEVMGDAVDRDRWALAGGRGRGRGAGSALATARTWRGGSRG
ncbi:MAG: hypothetical protein KAT75_07230 [Dehalococcoidia bacterium]|nr:hypothetical protein [Dehalococcoidia bacterium]